MRIATGEKSWLSMEQFTPVIVMFVGLFLVTFAFDIAFDRMGINPASTLLNDFSIGYFGAAIILYYQIKSDRDRKVILAQDKARLSAEMKDYVHEELKAISASAAVDDREERMRRTADAARRISAFLEGFGPVEAAPGPVFASASRN